MTTSQTNGAASAIASFLRQGGATGRRVDSYRFGVPFRTPRLDRSRQTKYPIKVDVALVA
jgi:hypothetical protein